MPIEHSSNTNWLINQNSEKNQLPSYPNKLYIGIDFGTSTTVVSQVVITENSVEKVKTLTLNQPDEYGATIRHHLVNTVLAWRNKTLIWGQDAYRLKSLLTESRNVFSSFKMRLGLAIGPTYPLTALSESKAQPYIIETAEDATQVFFSKLLESIKNETGNSNLENYKFAFSVPASFEANQRRSLFNSLEECGIVQNQCCLIDEPNAAFLSFVYDCTRNNATHPFLEKLKSRPTNILVYDFGAGTCDVTVLQVDACNNKFSSKNLAISKFTALGGDDIDRAIAKNILLPQLLRENTHFKPDSRDISEIVIPVLQATAEQLKIAVCKWLEQKNINQFRSLDQYSSEIFTLHSLEGIKVRDSRLNLTKPSIRLDEFKIIMDDFVGVYDGIHTPMHLASPIEDALSKANIEREDIDGVLFIGGSCLNPLVQSCVMNYMNEFSDEVEAILPKDVRAHVSLGAAIHSFSYHGLGIDFIRPIVSEAIYIITSHEHLETIIPASTEVPTPQPFHTQLIVTRDDQNIIDLPICVGSKSKLLGILTVEIEDDYFKQGAIVDVYANINHEKLLNVEAVIDGIKVNTSILNPLANNTLTKVEERMLRAKQKFNQALLDYNGRPPVYIANEYASACSEAGAYELAADLYIAIERLDRNANHATNICYNYARAGKSQKSNEWAEIAYKRSPNAVNAFNIACKSYGEKEELYLRKALEHDPNFTSALLKLGKILKLRADKEGTILLEKALLLLQDEIYTSSVRIRDCDDLIEVCDILDGYEQLKSTATDTKKKIIHENKELYSSENLVSSLKPNLGMKEG